MLTHDLLFSICCLLGCAAEFYVIDDRIGLGREFDGIGGLSGGGVSYLNFLHLTKLCAQCHTLQELCRWLRVTNLLSLTGHFTTSGQL